MLNRRLAIIDTVKQPSLYVNISNEHSKLGHESANTLRWGRGSNDLIALVLNVSSDI